MLLIAGLLSPLQAADLGANCPTDPRTDPGPDLGLIEAATLQQQADRWVLLDARPKAKWAAGHLPGATSFSWEDYTRTDAQGIPYRPWSPQELAAVLGRLGISATTPLVVYGDADTSWGGEGWTVWLLAWLGHRGPIRLLAGGVQAWQEAQLPLTRESAAAKETTVYQVSPRADLFISTDQIVQAPQGQTLVDVRSLLEWVKGRVPGAVHIPWEDFYQGPNRTPLTPDAVKKLLADNGIDPAKPIVFYCTGGIRSAFAWLVCQLAGLHNGRNYEGGMEAWTRRPQP
jgi:thiosulfate/3-mercaptopyruvate sulfurtransferase